MRRTVPRVTVFGLVHGAWHGGWAWERRVPELERAGHAVVAPDLPCDDPAADTPDYARVVADALGEADDVVLVGHSLAGLTVPLVAAARPVRRLVLIAALLAAPGRSLIDQLKEEPGILLPPPGDGLEHDEPRRSRWLDPGFAGGVLSGDGIQRVAARECARLRPKAREPQVSPSPLTAWP